MRVKILVLAIAIAFGSCAYAAGNGFKEGSADASGAVTGSAGVDGAKNAAPTLEKCSKPLGKIAVYEPQDDVIRALSRMRLPSPRGLIRMMIQQSNCFIVVERGQAMQNIMQERNLAEAGEARKGSNMGKGQLAAADYVLTPEINFAENNAGGAGGALGAIGSFFGPIGMIAGAIAGGVKFKQAQTSLVLADTRSGLQVAAAQGSAEKTDWGVGGALGGASAIGALGAYENTNEGKVVAAAFLNAWNNIIVAVRDNMELVRDESSLKSEAGTVIKTETVVNAEAVTKAATVLKVGKAFADGDVVRPKLGKISVLVKPMSGSKAVKVITKEMESIVDGEEKDGFLPVRGDGFTGWVETKLMRKIDG